MREVLVFRVTWSLLFKEDLYYENWYRVSPAFI